MNLERAWQRQAALTARGVGFAHSDSDPGELWFDAMELFPEKGKRARWESIKARAMALAMRKAGMR